MHLDGFWFDRDLYIIITNPTCSTGSHNVIIVLVKLLIIEVVRPASGISIDDDHDDDNMRGVQYRTFPPPVFAIPGHFPLYCCYAVGSSVAWRVRWCHSCHDVSIVK